MTDPFNPPVAWILTAAEIAVGGWIVSAGYPVFGGVVMGAAGGAFVARAGFAKRLRRVISDAAAVGRPTPPNNDGDTDAG